MYSCLEEFRLVEEMGQWPQRVTQRVRNPHGILVGQSGCQGRLLKEVLLESCRQGWEGLMDRQDIFWVHTRALQQLEG